MGSAVLGLCAGFSLSYSLSFSTPGPTSWAPSLLFPQYSPHCPVPQKRCPGPPGQVQQGHGWHESVVRETGRTGPVTDKDPGTAWLGRPAPFCMLVGEAWPPEAFLCDYCSLFRGGTEVTLGGKHLPPCSPRNILCSRSPSKAPWRLLVHKVLSTGVGEGWGRAGRSH